MPLTRLVCIKECFLSNGFISYFFIPVHSNQIFFYLTYKIKIDIEKEKKYAERQCRNCLKFSYEHTPNGAGMLTIEKFSGTAIYSKRIPTHEINILCLRNAISISKWNKNSHKLFMNNFCVLFLARILHCIYYTQSLLHSLLSFFCILFELPSAINSHI